MSSSSGKKRIPFFAYPAFKNHGVLAATSLAGPARDRMNLALHTGDDRERVLKNRLVFFKSFRINFRDLVCLDQEHGSHVIKAVSGDRGRGATDPRKAIRGDAVITDILGLPIVIFTADCVPVLAFEPVKKVCALIHAGWRGTEKLILQKTLEKMKKEYGCDPARIIITNGPYISDCCYKVNPDFKRNFPDRFFIKRKDGLYFNLLGPLRDQAIAAGLSAKNIRMKKTCTACKGKKFFSYRRGTGPGRMATVMMLK
jgi:polyphenol oxidase